MLELIRSTFLSVMGFKSQVVEVDEVRSRIQQDLLDNLVELVMNYYEIPKDIRISEKYHMWNDIAKLLRLEAKLGWVGNSLQWSGTDRVTARQLKKELDVAEPKARLDLVKKYVEEILVFKGRIRKL